MRAVIFANGEIRDADRLRSLLRADDWIIAADGGAKHCRRLGLTPAVLIGDLDSLSPAEARRQERAGVDVIRFPQAKDYTDLELALRHAAEHGVDEVLILGGLGGRWDQTMANLLLPASREFTHLRVTFQDRDDEIRLLSGGETVTLDGASGDVVSLMAVGASAEGVTTTGLAYPLTDEGLALGSTRGVSNVIAGQPCRVSLRRGVLLCFHSRQADRTSKTQRDGQPEARRRKPGGRARPPKR
jgi:thiamine pyrophosphokinase